MDWMFNKIPLAINDVREIEIVLGLSLPVEYKQILLTNHGARPAKKRFKTSSQKERVVKTFIPVTGDYEVNLFSVMDWLGLQEGIIPFASTPSGDYLCLSYEEDLEPFVVLYHHEIKSFEHVRQTFQKFLLSLY